MFKRLLVLSAAGALLVCAPASASVTRTVLPGESLWSIATANGLSPAGLAAANGLAPDAYVIEGTDIVIPAAGETVSGAPSGGAPQPLGSYVVRLGDTLTNIAERSGVAAESVAAMNGLDPSGVLQAGTVLKLPTGAALQPSAPAPDQRIVPDAAPYPTSEVVSSSTIGQIAASHGVPSSLAAAIAWQESGFDNSMVSDANARGVMQILPGTWTWINGNLSSGPLDASSAEDNVEAGVLYLGQLLRDTGGDSSLAVASYYQGLGSVRRVGVLPETQRYVDDVLALRARFGG
jgi:soluble lytic murein transglycosylase-like protein